jgi:tripartite-type tricarboxylate transporter receptor subunit TctC
MQGSQTATAPDFITWTATQERMMRIGYEPAGSTPRQLAEHIRAELARYARLIKAIGFKE